MCTEARGRLATWKEATGRGAMQIAGSNAEKLLGADRGAQSSQGRRGGEGIRTPETC